MIKFAALCPHPPVIVPGVDKNNDNKIFKHTIDAMEKLSTEIAQQNIDTIIVISPHGLIYPDRMNIWYGGEFDGDFKEFGAAEEYLEFLSDDELAQNICKQVEESGILVNHYTENYILDHGVMVPMYYLSKHLSEDVKIIPINYSYLDTETHYKFGQIIGNICQASAKNIAIIASGDLSHKIFGSDTGKSFDKTIIGDLKKNNFEAIVNYDEDWVADAGECGYKSLITLLGSLDCKQNITTKVLSYEAPFGIGYGVVEFKL